MNRNILVLEDNIACMQMILDIINNIEDCFVYTADTVDKGYRVAMEQNIDLFILDIILDTETVGDASGITFAENIRKIERYRFTPIIMTTSLEDPKLHAYSKIHCYQYFEKPYDKKDVMNAIVDALAGPRTVTEKKNIYYKKNGILYSVMLDEIIYMVSKKTTMEIHCVEEVLKAPYKSCKSWLGELQNSNFCQCSKSTIVNKAYISTIDATNRYITLKGSEDVLEIGIKMKKEFLKEVLG